jgi:hypothetical protein
VRRESFRAGGVVICEGHRQFPLSCSGARAEEFPECCQRESRATLGLPSSLPPRRQGAADSTPFLRVLRAGEALAASAIGDGHGIAA